MSVSGLALLEYMRGPVAKKPESDATLRAFQEAAAVLAAIADLSHLQPVGTADPAADPAAILAADLIPATGRKFHGTVMMSPEIRHQAIVRLVARGEVQLALDANPAEREGPIQHQLEQYLLGTAPPLDEQSLAELDATQQVAIWLRDAVPGVPSEAEVQHRAAYYRLLAPFEAIAGDGVFRGRVKELDELRDYVGVVAPASFRRRLRSRAFKWAAPARKPAISISGPGGVGKSALVARFMLENARLPEKGRVPFAYLDFDRPDLDAGDPFGLIVEMVRQLDIEFMGGQFAHARGGADEQRSKLAAADPGSRLEAAESLLDGVLAAMAAKLGPRPYLVVLDTFEEVQYRGESRAFPLWELLDRRQVRWPFLRVVISGRAPVRSLRLAGEPPKSLELGELDADAALAFLVAQGVRDEALARTVVKSYGGVPLTLKLVASLFAQDPAALAGAEGAATRGDRFLGASDEVIQGQLYDRLLSHIGDEAVRRLAHPGLVLRRITPEVIYAVLNAPCDLGLASVADAQPLFDGLQRENSLVTLDESDGALVHRQDLRRVMLKLLLASEPARVSQIRALAIAYYDQMGGRRGTAEATYHRLFLDQFNDESLLKDPEVRASIQASIVEFPIAVQLRLAGLGLDVPVDVRGQAGLELQEQSTAALIEERLPNGRRAELDAQQILALQMPDLDHPSPLFRSAARVELQLGNTEAARSWIGRGLEQAAPSGATLLTLRLLQEKAWLEVTVQQRATPETLSALSGYAERHDDQQARLQVRLHQFDPAAANADRSVAAFADLLAAVQPYDIWSLAPAARDVVGLAVEVGASAPLAALQQQVLERSSPFRFAGFADRGVQERLEAALSPDADPVRFGLAFQALLAEWPYRILFVDPPIGRGGGEYLAESAS